MGLRQGLFGEYYGSDFNSSNVLDWKEMEVNALYIYGYLNLKGWSVNAIAGLLGNMQHESSINPGRWQSDDVGNYNIGYGLVQWTPATKYTDWCSERGYSDPSEMDNNLLRIIYEVENNIQYIATDDYPESFSEFTKSTESPYYLACAFAFNYERSYVALYGSEAEKEMLRNHRGGSANDWYTYLTASTPPDPSNPSEPDETTKKRKKYKFVLFNRRRRIF